LSSNGYICHNIFDPEDVGSMFLWNIRAFLPDCMESHPRTQYSSQPSLWESLIQNEPCSLQAFTPEAQDGGHRLASRCGRFLPNTFHFIYRRLGEPRAHMDDRRRKISTSLAEREWNPSNPLIELSRKYSNSWQFYWASDQLQLESWLPLKARPLTAPLQRNSRPTCISNVC
jgi:hypothetical protein